MSDTVSKVPGLRWLTVLVGALCVLAPWSSNPLLSLGLCLPLLLLTALLVAGLAGVVRLPDLPEWPLLALVVAASGVSLVLTSGITFANGTPGLLVAMLTAPLLVLGPGGVLSTRRPSRARLVVLSVAYAALVLFFVTSWSWLIDVDEFIEGGIHALLHGGSPYAITVPDVYPQRISDRLYGPEISQDGRVVYGFAYLPAPLLLDLPGYWLGDVAWMHGLVLAGGIVACWRLTTDRLGRASVVMLAANPSTPVMLANYWVESLMIGFLALTVWGMSRTRTWAVAVGLGVLFATKQYAIYYLPAVWSVVRGSGLRAVVIACALAVAIVVPVALMDLHHFFRSAVSFQLALPFRDDALSFLPVLRLWFGDLPSWLFVGLPLLGTVVSGVVAWRTVPGPTAFALSLGLGLLVTVLFSKQSFVNYFMLVGAALTLAAACWPAHDPVVAEDPTANPRVRDR